MFKLETIVRKNIQSLTPYSSARDEFSGKDGIFLDANENPFGEWNRYPDPYQKNLKQKLGEINDLSTSNIFIGNGSDEVIDLTLRIFCNPGKDNIIICPPTYGMYEVAADINDIIVQKVDLTSETFQLNTDKILAAINKNTKLIFICCPNNPTGNGVKWLDIKRILEIFTGIVVVDEAYIDFSEYQSLTTYLPNYSNMIIMQTLSKAWGLAGARIGIAFTSAEIIAYFNKIKPPYNVSSLNQQAAIKALNNYENIKRQKAIILNEKNIIINKLKNLYKVKKIYPSDANFLLVEVGNANAVYQNLVAKKIITRNRNTAIKNCIRITIGKPEENIKLIEALT